MQALRLMLVAVAMCVAQEDVVKMAKLGLGALDARAEDSMCCKGMCTAPKNKYYSIATDFKGSWNCGETCLEDSKYPIFHIFEKNLTKAATGSPCADRGYNSYETTVTHGVWPIRCTLDLYGCSDPKGCPHP